MTKTQLEKVVDRYLAATRHAIVNARGLNGNCRFCGVSRGLQHAEDCALWPLVSARIQHRVEEDPPARDGPGLVETMTALETGRAPNAPVLNFTQAATASSEVPPA